MFGEQIEKIDVDRWCPAEEQKSTIKSEHSSAFVEMDILKLSNMKNILLAVTSNLKKMYTYYYAAKEDRQLNTVWNYNFIGRIIRFVESSKD